MYASDVSAVVGISILALLYAGASFGLGRRPESRQAVAFGLGLAVMFGALTGPIDYYVRERSFALYIFQQVLLVLVIPPLLLLGLPDWMARRLFLSRVVARPWRFLTTPLVAFLLFSSIFALIHYPAVCDVVCHVRPPYGDIRELLLLTGIVLWWPLLSPLPEYPRLPYSLQILYLFLLMIPMTAVAAPITMARTVLYAFYQNGPHPFGLPPLADQILGGLIMWVGQGLYLMCVFTAIFYRWSQREDREVPPLNLRRPPELRVLNRPRRAGA